MDNRFEFTTQHCVQFLFTVSSQISSKYVCQSHDHFSRVGTNFETNLFFTGALEQKEPTPLRAAPEKSLISPRRRVTDIPLRDRSEKKKGCVDHCNKKSQIIILVCRERILFPVIIFLKSYQLCTTTAKMKTNKENQEDIIL